MSRHRRGRTALFFIIHSYKYKLIIKGNEGLTEEFSKAWFFIISYYNYISLIKKLNEGLIEEHSSDVSLIYILWYYFANQIACWKRTDLGHISLCVIAGHWSSWRLLISIFNTFFSSYQGHCVAIGEISLKYFQHVNDTQFSVVYYFSGQICFCFLTHSLMLVNTAQILTISKRRERRGETGREGERRGEPGREEKERQVGLRVRNYKT